MAPTFQSVRNPTASVAPAPTKKQRNRFTAQMADRQARGKDPMTGDAPLPWGQEDDDENLKESVDEKGRAKIEYTGDGYEAKERRQWANTTLNSLELLMMFAQSRGDTIPSTRYYLTRMLCGVEDTRKPLRRKGKREEKELETGKKEEVLVQAADDLDLSGQ